MPQIRKGGKFVFGWSKVRPDYTIQIPPQALTEYSLVDEGKVILISGSKQTGGLCVSTKAMLQSSIMRGAFEEHPDLASYKMQPGCFARYKGRLYGWCSISPDGLLSISQEALDVLKLQINDKLLVIRSSDIAITMGAKGTLVDSATQYEGEIPVF